MRCPDCNKFVSQDLADPEVNDLTIDPEGNVHAEVRVVVTCADCGTELKETNLEMEMDLSDKLKGHLSGDDGEHELTIDEDGSEGIEDMKTTDRHGKKIKSARYMTKLYGARVDFKVTCSCQGDDCKDPLHEGQLEETTEAGSMDELV